MKIGFSSFIGKCYAWEQRQFTGLALAYSISFEEDLYFLCENDTLKLFLPKNERADEFLRSWERRQRPLRLVRRIMAMPHLVVPTTRCLGSYAPPAQRQLRQRLFQKRRW